MYRRCLVLLSALGLVLGGCEDASAPAGENSTVTVRAFVDANGSGAFDTGDVPLSGLAITLQSTATGGTAYNATTGANGVATFSDVAPGSYEAALGGNAPAGAVLSSAQKPVLVAPFKGGEVSGEFRFAYMPGSISGVLYRDNNGNNQYDAGVDTPAPGLTLTLLGATGTTALGTTTTSAAGAFAFGPLRPGTYRVAVGSLPTMQIVGGDTLSVTVGPQAPSAVPVKFTGNLLSSVSDARKQPSGTVVAFEGVATVGVGVFSTSTTGNQFNVQDASGAGILVLGVPLSSGIQAGDSVRIVGTTRVSSGEFLINSSPAPQITKLASGRPLPAPKVLTIAQVAASDSTDANQGALVTVGNVLVDSVGTASSSGGYNVYVSDGAGKRFIVRVGTTAVGVDRTYWTVGRRYDITGTLANFNGAQVKIRSAADVAARSVATPIGTLRVMALNDSAGLRFDTVTVEGVVNTAQGVFNSGSAYIQDATGGILVFNIPATAGLVVGDSVRVRAVVDYFNSELELVRFSSTVPPVVEKLGTGATPQPASISGAQMLTRLYEGMLVRLGNVVADSVGTVSGTSGSYTVWVLTTDGQRVQIFVASSAIGIPASTWVKGNRYNVVGPLADFRRTPQVKPRSAADVTAGTSVVSIATAEQRPAGDTVTVEGVVISPTGITSSATGSNVNAYIYDGSAGIQIFNVPGTLAVGDLVRVRGIMASFNNELEIVKLPGTTSLDVTVIGTSPVPAPRAITGAQFLARTYEGELVTLSGVTVTAVGTVSSSGGYNVTATAADGSVITIRHDRTAVGIPASFWVVGGIYDVTGIATNFVSSGNNVPQLKPRGPADAVRR